MGLHVELGRLEGLAVQVASPEARGLDRVGDGKERVQVIVGLCGSRDSRAKSRMPRRTPPGDSVKLPSMRMVIL